MLPSYLLGLMRRNIALFKELENKNILLLNHPLTEIKALENYTEFDLVLQ